MAMESSSNLPETQNLLNSIRQFEHGMRAFAIVEGLLPDMIGGENQVFKNMFWINGKRPYLYGNSESYI
jgi:hypothetical protein